MELYLNLALEGARIMDGSGLFLYNGSIQAQSFPVLSTFLAGLISCNEYIRQIYIRFFVYTICFTTSEGTIRQMYSSSCILQSWWKHCQLSISQVCIASDYQKMATRILTQSDSDGGHYELMVLKGTTNRYITLASQQYDDIAHHFNYKYLFPQNSDRDCNYKLYLVQS